MGVELHITRAEFWADNQRSQISIDDWLAYVEGDPELQLRPENGPGFVMWTGPSKYAEPWLDWSAGNISTKWPDTALYGKMLRIAASLKAKVQDDDGEVYAAEGDWSFDPTDGPRPPASPDRQAKMPAIAGLVAAFVTAGAVSWATPDGNLVVTLVPALVVGLVVYALASWLQRRRKAD